MCRLQRTGKCLPGIMRRSVAATPAAHVIRISRFPGRESNPAPWRHFTRLRPDRTDRRQDSCCFHGQVTDIDANHLVSVGCGMSRLRSRRRVRATLRGATSNDRDGYGCGKLELAKHIGYPLHHQLTRTENVHERLLGITDGLGSDVIIRKP